MPERARLSVAEKKVAGTSDARSSRGASPEARRLGADRCLEQAAPQSSSEVRFVPVLPAGDVCAGRSWRFFVFEQVHTGALGGHLNESQTVEHMRRLCY